MQNLPEIKTLEDVRLYYGTVDDCLDYLEHIRYGSKIKCNKCGCDSHRRHVVRKEWTGKRVCDRCGERFSVKDGTIFDGSWIPLTEWFAVICIYANEKDKKAITSNAIHNQLNIPIGWAELMLEKIKLNLAENDFNKSLHKINQPMKPEKKGYFKFTTEQKLGLWPFVISFVLFAATSLLVTNEITEDILSKMLAASVSITATMWIFLFVRFIVKVVRKKKDVKVITLRIINCVPDEERKFALFGYNENMDKYWYGSDGQVEIKVEKGFKRYVDLMRYTKVPSSAPHIIKTIEIRSNKEREYSGVLHVVKKVWTDKSEWSEWRSEQFPFYLGSKMAKKISPHKATFGHGVALCENVFIEGKLRGGEELEVTFELEK